MEPKSETPGSRIDRPDYEEAERKLYRGREKDTKRRLAKSAWESFYSSSTASDGEGTLDPAESSTTESSLRLGDLIDLDEFDEPAETDTGDDITPEATLSERSRIATEKMRELIWHNYLESGRELFALEKAISRDEFLLGIATQEILQRNPRAVSTRGPVTDRLRDRIDNARERKEEIEETSPEGYALIKGHEFKGHVEEITNGRVVTTPYVRGHLDRIKNNIIEGRPTFLHGHLGSGKTEVAITAVREATIERTALEVAQTELQAYVKENPNSDKSERLDMLMRFYDRNLRKFEKASRDGDERFSPLIISGSKDLTSQDLFADRTLKLTKFNGKPLLEHKEDLDAEIETWKKEHPEDAEDPEKARRAADEIIELYKLKNQAFGTEVEVVKQAIYRGAEEGRPVIIDEINAIPSAVLISLNDILQRRPGETCYIPGVGQIEIKPGFSIIMTGNLSQGNVSYFGTEELNPAFLSRLDVIEHDYLPMSMTDPNFREQDDPSKNELFQVVLAYLADRQGNLELPEMEKSLQKLFAMCQLSHETGLIFGGKWQESNSLNSNSGDDIEPSLEKSVLSIRNLLNVIMEWDKGSEKDLDKALWDGFITNITNPDDQNFILGLAKRYGFFQDSDGWHVEIKARGSGFTSLDEIHPGPFNFKREAAMDTYSIFKVIEVLYGPGPRREIYPDAVELDEIEDLVNDDIDLKDLEIFEEKLTEVGKSIKALEVLGEQCGCNNNANQE